MTPESPSIDCANLTTQILVATSSVVNVLLMSWSDKVAVFAFPDACSI